MLDKKDLRKQKIEDLNKMSVEYRTKIADIYLNMRMGKVSNLHEPRELRKDLAVIYTILREKQLVNLKESTKDE